MNILIIRSNGVNPDSRVEKEANTLINMGYHVKILGWDRDSNYIFKNEKLALEDGYCHIVRYGIRAGFGAGLANFLPLLKSQLMILRYLIKNRKNIDIVHACDFDTAFSSFLFCKFFNKKMVYDIFDYYIDAFSVPNRLKNIIEWIDIKIINNADAVIIVNESRREQIRKANPKKIYIIHNSPKMLKNTKEYESEKEFNEKKVNLCYVGILSESRFLKEVLDVVSQNKNYYLNIGGFGKLEKYCRDMSSKHENINFLGRLSYTDVIKLENNSDILFAIYDPKVPNHRYSSPNKLYEALMLGKPIIVAKGTGIDKLVDEMGIGISINYVKLEFELALESLIEVLKYEKNDLAERCKKIYHKSYSWTEMEKRLKQLYSEI